MKAIYFFLFSLCLQAATAQPLQRVPPEQVGMDSRKLMYADEAIETAISNKDIPGKPLKFLGGMQYFLDGRLLFTNWVGHVNPEQRNHLFLVDREKNILCTVENREGIQTMSSVFSLDENGKSYH